MGGIKLNDINNINGKLPFPGACTKSACQGNCMVNLTNQLLNNTDTFTFYNTTNVGTTVTWGFLNITGDWTANQPCSPIGKRAIAINLKEAMSASLTSQ